MAGNRLAQQMFWVPQSGDIGVGVSILSYNNNVQFGLITDRKFVPEPARIVECFAPEFNKLALYLLMNGLPPEMSDGATPATAMPEAMPATKPKAARATPKTRTRKAARRRDGAPKKVGRAATGKHGAP